jgi:hypothetical protein
MSGKTPALWKNHKRITSETIHADTVDSWRQTIIHWNLKVENPLTRLVAADDNAAPIHPLPQGGEGCRVPTPSFLPA